MGFEIGKTVAGYQVVEVLGSSKTGVAYKVRNVFAQRFEVLKILPKSVQADEEQTARFLREIKLHAQLVHPNIVTFYNAREIDGQLVMTTEFVPGSTVAELLEKGPLEWRDAGRYAYQALSALEYAHSQGIIHRGLGPSHLTITPEGMVRMNGFGLAKSVADPQLTAVGTVMGALHYASPEQIQGAALDARCDIYSLGVVLHEMLTGKYPFEAKGQFEIMLAHVNAAPKHASDLSAEVPRELGDVVMKALAKEPDQRFQNAREFRGALERIGIGQEASPAAAPVSAAPAAPAVLVHDIPAGPEPIPAEMKAVQKMELPAPPPAEVKPAAAASASATFLGLPAALVGSLGDSFVSRLGITLAACAITFLLGSVAILALLAMSKP